jgi:hypothetical protein
MIDEEGKKLAREAFKKFVAPVPDSVDCREWARKILANPRNYPLISKQFAEEALGVHR